MSASARLQAALQGPKQNIPSRAARRRWRRKLIADGKRNDGRHEDVVEQTRARAKRRRLAKRKAVA